ncbi:unnamed protein product [Allacma fusca]|uniref:Ras-associating domain-containing protein n=1 Tax=Allacma fusca TaxID=39272 RepID=A0A8J2KJP4_9HEXA|nr:unnamed protein product [Allacma fusca]
MTEARKHLSKLQDLQKRLDTIWKGSRWIIDVVTISRDKSVALVSVETLLDTSSESELAFPFTETRSNDHGNQPQIRVSIPNFSGEQIISKFDGTSPLFSSISSLSLRPLPESCTDVEKAAQISSQLVDENPFLFKPGLDSIHSSQSQCDVSNFILSQAQSAERILSSSLHDLYSSGGTYKTNHLLNASLVNQATNGSSSKRNVIVPDCVSLPCQYDFYLRFGIHPLPMRSRRSNTNIKTDSTCQLGAPKSTNFSVLTQSAVASSLGCTSTSCAHVVNVPATNTYTVAGEFSLSHPSTIIQVYAAYDCGLSEGTSVKIQIISVVGARERCLRNDFNPLQLQNPWKSGKMYVRRRRDVTAAIEMNSR